MNETKMQQSSVLNIVSLDNSLFEKVVQYLDSKSITQLVLVSRTIRFKVGDVQFQAIKNQIDYKNRLTQSYSLLCDSFNEIDNVLQQFSSDFTSEHYFEMVQLIQYHNINFFSTLYSLILNKQINLTFQELHQQKKGLSQIGPNILHSFEQIRITQTLPSIDFDETNLQNNPLSLGFNGQKNKLFKAMTQFVDCLIKINHAKLTSKDYQNYKQLQNYYKNVNIKTSNNTLIYKYKIYYTQKKMLDVLNKNSISLVFKFLPVEDILKLRLLNKWFCHQLPSFLQSSMVPMANNIEILKNQLNQTDPILIDLITKNLKLNLNQQHFWDISGMTNPSRATQEIIRIFTLITPQTKNQYKTLNYCYLLNRYNKEVPRKSKESIFSLNYYIEYTKEDMQKIEEFLQQFPIEKLFITLYALVRMYYSIIINYFLTKLHIQKNQYDNLIKIIQQITNNPKLILQYQSIYQKLIQKKECFNSQK